MGGSTVLHHTMQEATAAAYRCNGAVSEKSTKNWLLSTCHRFQLQR